MTNNRKWYIGTRSAEGEAVFFVDLSEDEKDAVIRFASAQYYGPDEGYSGSFSIDTKNCFNTLEEAVAYAKKDERYEYVFECNPNWNLRKRPFS